MANAQRFGSRSLVGGGRRNTSSSVLARFLLLERLHEYAIFVLKIALQVRHILSSHYVDDDFHNSENGKRKGYSLRDTECRATRVRRGCSRWDDTEAAGSAHDGRDTRQDRAAVPSVHLLRDFLKLSSAGGRNLLRI